MNSRDFFNLTLPEQLILLSIDTDGQTSWRKASSWLHYGVIGAVLQELVDHQKIKLVVEEYKHNNSILGKDNTITIADAGQLNCPVMNQAMIALILWLKQYPAVSGLSRSVANCVNENPFANIGLVFHQRLVAGRILRSVRKRLWGIIPWTRNFFATEKELHQQLRQIIKKNLQTAILPNQPLTKILLLAAACRLDLQNLLPTERLEQNMTIINTMAGSNPITEGVARAIFTREKISFL